MKKYIYSFIQTTRWCDKIAFHAVLETKKKTCLRNHSVFAYLQEEYGKNILQENVIYNLGTGVKIMQNTRGGGGKKLKKEKDWKDKMASKTAKKLRLFIYTPD